MSLTVAFEREASPASLAAFDTSPHLLCVRDMQGRLVRVNKAWEATLGYAVDEVANTPLLSLIHPADVSETRIRMAEANGRKDIADFVNRYRRRDGYYRLMRWRAHRIGDVILGEARDVTDHYRRYTALEMARQAIDDLILDASNQVGAPTGEIRNIVRNLGRAGLTQAQSSLLRNLQLNLKSLEDLASQMIAVERLDADRATFPAPAGQARVTVDPPVEASPAPGAAVVAPGQHLARGARASNDARTSLRAWIVDASRHSKDHRGLYNSLRDLSGQVLGLLSIRLDHEGDFYPRRLFSLIAQSGLMSAGRAAALLRRLQDTGFVAVDEAFRAGLIRRYRLLPATRQAFVGQLMVNLKSMAGTDPVAASALEAIEIDEQRAIPLLANLAEVLMRDLGSDSFGVTGLLNGASLMAKGRDIALALAADAITESGEIRDDWIEASPTSYAQRFDVSRAHVRRVFVKLDACGLFRSDAFPSMIKVSSAFIDEVERLRLAECDLLRRALEMQHTGLLAT